MKLASVGADVARPSILSSNQGYCLKQKLTVNNTGLANKFTATMRRDRFELKTVRDHAGDTLIARRKRGPKGTAFNKAVFQSALARRGGPIRLSIDSIDRNSTRASLLAATVALGWRVIELGDHWLLLDARIKLLNVVRS